MKKLLLILLIPLLGESQTLYRSDYIETFDVDWSGYWWIPIASTNYYTNEFVSSNASAVLYGTGNGTSGYEGDWYTFPNLVVNPVNDYYFTFRVASYRFTSSATTRGVDVGDYVTVQLSTDGGTNYVNELRITGGSNAYWNYNGASYTKTANGTLTTIGPAAGGDRTSTGDGYSTIRLNIPPNTSNIAIDIFARANSAGEEWWFDNFELHEIVNPPLPVELIYFDGKSQGDVNRLFWSTASEYNSDYFSISESSDGENWSDAGIVKASGNSNHKIDYNFSYIPSEKTINYYKLIQYDLDGKYKIYGPISIDNRESSKKVLRYTNIQGQDINPEYLSGIIIVVYDDGTTEKIIR